MLSPFQVENDWEADGIKIPPTDIKRIVYKVAGFMTSIEPQSEKRIVANNAGSLHKYGFRYDGNIYHPCYQHQLSDLGAQYGYVKTDRLRPNPSSYFEVLA